MNRLLIIVAVFLLFLGCNYLEQYDSHYANYTEVVNSQSWKGGWIPKLLPKDAVNIQESHYIDRTSVILVFDFSKDFKSKLDKICNNKKKANIQFAIMNAKWWPNSLTRNATFSNHEYYYYSCHDTEGFFAIPFGSKKAYYWRL